ncbi:MAG: hypothetical protein CML66_25805 [Rhodobacteraceae bacterium]|nr:hypothetical protein [Paracoccaceae bacterium]MAY44661.1 hypothetical protein [Paracoccaceae bacterium]
MRDHAPKPDLTSRPKPRSRESDERTLEWIALRNEGLSAARIARRYGVNPGSVVHATNAVRDADRAEAGESVSGYAW